MRRLNPIALLLLAATAIAAEPYVVVERQLIRPTGGDPAYVLVDPDQDGDPQGSTREIGWSYESAGSARVGIAIDRTERIELGAFLFDQGASDAVSAPAGGALWDIYYTQGNSQGEMADTDEARAEARSTLRAWNVDLRWIHAIELEHWRCDVSVGLRRTSLRDAYEVRYSITGSAWRAEHLSEAIATGVVGGIAVRRGWWDDRFGVHAELSYATLRGTLAGESAHMTEQGSFDVFEFDRGAAGFVQTDLSLGADLALGAGFTLAGSYRIGRWQGMVRDDQFTFGSERHVAVRDLLWEGFVVSLGWAGAF